jgi:hypothetical protein
MSADEQFKPELPEEQHQEEVFAGEHIKDHDSRDSLLKQHMAKEVLITPSKDSSIAQNKSDDIREGNTRNNSTLSASRSRNTPARNPSTSVSTPATQSPSKSQGKLKQWTNDDILALIKYLELKYEDLIGEGGNVKKSDIYEEFNSYLVSYRKANTQAQSFSDESNYTEKDDGKNPSTDANGFASNNEANGNSSAGYSNYPSGSDKLNISANAQAVPTQFKVMQIRYKLTSLVQQYIKAEQILSATNSDDELAMERARAVCPYYDELKQVLHGKDVRLLPFLPATMSYSGVSDLGSGGEGMGNESDTMIRVKIPKEAKDRASVNTVGSTGAQEGYDVFNRDQAATGTAVTKRKRGRPRKSRSTEGNNGAKGTFAQNNQNPSALNSSAITHNPLEDSSPLSELSSSSSSSSSPEDENLNAEPVVRKRGRPPKKRFNTISFTDGASRKQAMSPRPRLSSVSSEDGVVLRSRRREPALNTMQSTSAQATKRRNYSSQEDEDDDGLYKPRGTLFNISKFEQSQMSNGIKYSSKIGYSTSRDVNLGDLYDTNMRNNLNASAPAKSSATAPTNMSNLSFDGLNVGSLKRKRLVASLSEAVKEGVLNNEVGKNFVVAFLDALAEEL